MKIILASASPRRCDLLRQIGLDFVQRQSAFDECIANNADFSKLVMNNACGKATSVAATANELVLGADTVVVLAGQLLGKPKDAAQAKAMLSSLAGKTHEVYTGICVKHGEQQWQAFEKTFVTMRSLTEQEIAAYVATGEPLDKAGAYGIQGKGALLVEKIEGCYFNVVGLPLACLRALLEKAGYAVEY